MYDYEYTVEIIEDGASPITHFPTPVVIVEAVAPTAPEIVEIQVPGPQGPAGDGSTQIPVADGTGTYRLIAFINGTIRAIPVDTPDPVPPTGLAATATVSVVRLTWTAASTPGATYWVYRNGSEVGSTTATSYRDLTVTVNQHYTYQVQTRDPYGQRSALTTAVAAFTDPALNTPPVVHVTTWPAVIYPDAVTIVRVCGVDVDAQSLAYTLGVNAGSLTSTPDPSVWHLSV